MTNIYKLSFIFLFAGFLCLSSGGTVLAQTAPQVQTYSATNIQGNSATLNGYLADAGSYGSTIVYFQWGTSVYYGYQTSGVTQNYVGSFNQTISGLAPNTTFHFRAVAQNGYGTVLGQDMTFYTSQSNGGTLTVNAGPDLYITSGQTVTLQGSGYDPNGYALNYYWSCNGGTLSNYNVAQPVYTARYIGSYNNQTSYTCTITVTNSYGNSNSDSMIVYANSNNNNNNNYVNGPCNYHAYKLCAGNNVYWYSSCGVQQELYYSCANSQTCQYGQCVAYVQPVQPVYVVNYKTACYNNSLYWYDSLGVSSGLYKDCADTNSCTADTCSSNKCVNTPIPGCSTEPTPTPTPTPATAKAVLSLSFLTKQNTNTAQWQKTAEIGFDSQVYFMVSIANNSAVQADNVNISANIPTEISSIGNVKLDSVQLSGDIVAGINIGSISPTTTKTITFEGKTQTISTSSTKQATATSNVAGVSQSDSVSLTFNPGQTTASVSSASATTGFWGFLKRWYLWILAGLVLIFLFVVVFKRFSSEV